MSVTVEACFEDTFDAGEVVVEVAEAGLDVAHAVIEVTVTPDLLVDGVVETEHGEENTRLEGYRQHEGHNE